MISDNLANSISHSTTIKSFSKMYDPSKINIQRIFHDHWDSFLVDPEVIRRGIRPVVKNEVERMLSCGTLDAGFEIYECPHCHKDHIICYTCKSRFCNSCGTKYAKIRAENISNSTLNVNHRHIVFTIDRRLRNYFLKDRNLLNFLFDAAKDTLFYTFDKMNGKKKSFKPGFILTLHTFGRDLKWNPHIHCLCTEGGMDDEHNYIRKKYINYETLRKAFMKQLLDYIKSFYSDDPKTSKALKNLINQLYKDNSEGFYVNAPNMKGKNGKDAVVNYIIRYTGRPVMASSRILSYDHATKTIRYYYEDHKTEERIEVEENVITFMKKLVVHIPESQFKMIRYYGLYATSNHVHKEKISEILKKAFTKKSFNDRFKYRKTLISVFHTDPFLCDCGHYMEYVDYWVPDRRRKNEDELLC